MTLNITESDSPFKDIISQWLPAFIYEKSTNLESLEDFYGSFEAVFDNVYQKLKNYNIQLSPLTAETKWLYELGLALGINEVEDLSIYIDENNTITGIEEYLFNQLLVTQRMFVANNIFYHLLRGTNTGLERTLYLHGFDARVSELWTEDWDTFFEYTDTLSSTYGNPIFSPSGAIFATEERDILTEIQNDTGNSVSAIDYFIGNKYGYEYAYCQATSGANIGLYFKPSEAVETAGFDYDTWYAFAHSNDTLPSKQIQKIEFEDDNMMICSISGTDSYFDICDYRLDYFNDSFKKWDVRYSKKIDNLLFLDTLTNSLSGNVYGIEIRDKNLYKIYTHIFSQVSGITESLIDVIKINSKEYLCILKKVNNGDISYTGWLFNYNDILNEIIVMNIVSGISDVNYTEAHADFKFVLNNEMYGYGQSFPGNNKFLSSVKFYLDKRGWPTGNVYAKIYAHQGTYGTNGYPTGVALATSMAIDTTILPAEGSPALVEFTFSPNNRILLSSGTNYIVSIEYTTGTYIDGIYIWFGSPSTYPGNISYQGVDSIWNPIGINWDLVFYVLTEPAPVEYVIPITLNDETYIESHNALDNEVIFLKHNKNSDSINIGFCYFDQNYNMTSTSMIGTDNNTFNTITDSYKLFEKIIITGDQRIAIFDINTRITEDYPYPVVANYQNIFISDKLYLNNKTNNKLLKITGWNTFREKLYRTHYFEVILNSANINTEDLPESYGSITGHITNIINRSKPIHAELYNIIYLFLSEYLQDTLVYPSSADYLSTESFAVSGSVYEMDMIASFDGVHPYKRTNNIPIYYNSDGLNGRPLLHYGDTLFSFVAVTSAGDFDNLAYYNTPLP